MQNASFVGNGGIVTVFDQGVILECNFLIPHLQLEGTDAAVVLFVLLGNGTILIV